MRVKNKWLFLSVAFFLIFISYINIAIAQQGSLYFSVGYNKAWFDQSTIHVDQGTLGNSYDMLNVKGDNNTRSGISALQLNYRLGYYCNYEQNLGIELNFDPVNYRIKDGQKVHLKGIINGTANVSKTVDFSESNGYYYYFNSTNLLLFNLVKRFCIYRANTKKIGVDAILKGGAGPVLPHFQNSLPINPVNDPQLQYGGWNAGAELALRVTVYRYAYLEFAGKYDYANLNALAVDEGTAQQKLSTYEVIGSIGFTFPTTRYNPLFYHQTIITIIPLFVDAEDSVNNENKRNEDLLAMYDGPMQDIPEFDEIVDKRTKAYNDSLKLITDSMMRVQFADSMQVADSLLRAEKPAAPVMSDSTLNVNADSLKMADSTLNKGDSKKHKKRKKHKAEEAVTEPAAAPPAAPTSVAPPGDVPPAPPAAEEKPKPETREKKEVTEQKDKPEKADEKADQKDKEDKKESKKEKKKREKEERKEKKKKEKEEKGKADNAEKEKPAESPEKKDN